MKEICSEMKPTDRAMCFCLHETPMAGGCVAVCGVDKNGAMLTYLLI